MKRKLKPYTALVIKNKTCSTPWNYELFPTLESAKREFYKTCEKAGWNFDWENSFEVVEVKITPLTK